MLLSPYQNILIGIRFYARYCTTTTASQYPGPKSSRVRSTSTYVRYASTTPYIPTPQQRLADLQQIQKKITVDKMMNEMEREGRAAVAAAVAKKEEDVQIKLTNALEEELRVQQAALRRTTELDSFIQKHGYTVTQHDTSYRWTRTIDEYHVTITSNTGLPDNIHVKITKPGKGSNSIPAFVMELSLALNIDHVSVTDSHHAHPLILMPAPHRSLQPYSTTGTATATATPTPTPTPTPIASTLSEAQLASNQYQGWMCDCCGTASTSYSYHCQRGCEYDLLPSCITSIPDVACTPAISTCQIKNMSAHQTTDIPLESFSEDVQKRFHAFLESVGVDQQLARHVWLYSHEKKFASPTQATTTAKKVETLTALRNFFAQ